MTNYSLWDTDFKQFHVFMKVVELKSFTKAADVLFMTQSAVSKSILRLEKSLNLTLFIRNSKEIQVTPVGEYLYNQWVPALRTINVSLSKAYDIYAGTYTAISVATINTTVKNKYFWPLIQRFQELYPQITVNTNADTSEHLKNDFFRDDYDIVLVPDYERYGYESKKYLWNWIKKGSLTVYCHKDNPLSGNTSVKPEELSGQKFIVLRDERLPEYTRFFGDFCRKYGLEPGIHSYCQNPYAIEHYFNENHGIFLAHPYFNLAEHPNVRCIPVEHCAGGIVGIWDEANKNPYIQNFLKIAAESD